MSAIAAGIDPLPDGTEPLPPAVITRKRGWLRRLPGKAKVGAAILGLFLLIAVIGPTIAPFDPTASTPGQALPLGPTTTHLLGTTATGQDVLSQLLVGTRSTVVLGLLTGLIATLLAVVIGMSAGFLGGASDEGLSLLANVFLVLPALPLAGRDPRLPPPLGRASDRDRVERARVAMGSTRDPRPDPVAA